MASSPGNDDNGDSVDDEGHILPVVAGSLASPEEGGMLSRMLMSPTYIRPPNSTSAAAPQQQMSDEEMARQLAFAEEGTTMFGGGGLARSPAAGQHIVSMATSPINSHSAHHHHDDDEAFARQLQYAEEGTAFGGGIAMTSIAGSKHAKHGGGGSDEEVARRLQQQFDHDDTVRRRQLLDAMPMNASPTSAAAAAAAAACDRGGGLDFGLAMMLQQMELFAGAGEDNEEEVMVRELRLVDPVWGELVFPEGTRPRPCQVVCFSCCPCCSGEVCVKRGSGGNDPQGAADSSAAMGVPASQVMQRGVPSSSNNNSATPPPPPSPPTSTTFQRLLMCLCPYECAPSKVEVLAKLKRTLSCWLALVQVLMLFVTIILSEGFAPMKLNPMIGPWPTILNSLGAKNAALITYRGELWRLFTPMLLHAGLIHLAVNVLIQLRVGVLLELQWGLKHFSLIYVTSGLTSSIMSCLVLPDSLGVGSSGALMGLFGAWLVDLICKWPAADSGEDTSQRASQLFIVALNIFITMMFSFVPYVDWAAHLGGLIGGAVLALFLFGKDMNERFSEDVKFVVRWVGITSYVTFVAVGLTLTLLYLKPARHLLHVCKLYREHLDDPNIPC